MQTKSILTLGAGAIALLSTCSANKDQRPNVVLVMAEDMTLDLGCYGMKAVKTPVLDRLASEGIMYTNAHCSAPISSPSRSSLMTGIQCTVFDASSHRSNRDKPLPSDILPFTSYLRQSGYTCVLGGKEVWRNPVGNNLSQSSYKIDCNFKFTETGPYDGVENFGLFDCMDDLPAKGPFFNQITIFTTHRGDWWNDIRNASQHPVDPAEVELPGYMADHPKIRQEFAAYLDQVEYMDAEVGRLIDRLDASGRLDNTIIIFIGDNGRADIRGKGFLYEDGSRVPMIIWGGKKLKNKISHQVVTDLVGTIDIPATILSIAGVPVPENMESRPLLDSKLRPCLSRDALYTTRDNWDEVPECIRAINDGRYVYIRNYFPEYPYDRPSVYLDFHRPALWVMRDLKAKGQLKGPEMLFFTDTKPEEELYDCQADPQNLVNLASDPAYAEVLAGLRTKMDERIATTPDFGLADHREREKTVKLSRLNLRDFMLENHPDVFRDEVASGNLFLDYGIYNDEFKAWKRNRKK